MNLKNKKTPFYLYDLKEIDRNYNNLQASLTNRFEILYSMKANPHSKILERILNLKLKIDVSSLGEIKKARKAGFAFKNMSFVGPGKSIEELTLAVEKKIGCIVVESIGELSLVNQCASNCKKIANISIRINPSIYFSSSGQKRTSFPSQFGIPTNEIVKIVNAVRKSKNIQLVGLHFFLHSHFLNADNIIENFKTFIDIAIDVRNQMQTSLKIINFGGGFGVNYFNNQSELDLRELNKKIKGFLNQEKTEIFNSTKFYVESGRYLVASSAVFITKVLYKKSSYNKTILICDGGFTQHQAAAGVGQLIKQNYPILLLKKESLSDKDFQFEELYKKELYQIENKKHQTEIVTIAGPSCYSQDILARNINLENPKVGDYIVVFLSGAYGPSFSPQNFLSRPMAKELFWINER